MNKEEYLAIAIELQSQTKQPLRLIDLARKSNTPHSEWVELFGNSRRLYAYFYELLLENYQEMVADLEGYHLLSMGEKWANFIYTSYDMLSEHKKFVDVTFPIISSGLLSPSAIQSSLTSLFASFIDQDDHIAASIRPFLGKAYLLFLVKTYEYFVEAWLKDNSHDGERTMELVDKFTSFQTETLHSTIIDKGFDLVKTLYAFQFPKN